MKTAMSKWTEDEENAFAAATGRSVSEFKTMFEDDKGPVFRWNDVGNSSVWNIGTQSFNSLNSDGQDPLYLMYPRLGTFVRGSSYAYTEGNTIYFDASLKEVMRAINLLEGGTNTYTAKFLGRTAKLTDEQKQEGIADAVEFLMKVGFHELAHRLIRALTIEYNGRNEEVGELTERLLFGSVSSWSNSGSLVYLAYSGLLSTNADASRANNTQTVITGSTISAAAQKVLDQVEAWAKDSNIKVYK
jgi:hypothetical protein